MSDATVQTGPVSLAVEESVQIIAHGPMGSAPFSRRLVLHVGGERVEVQTRPFPTDAAAREAARAFREVLRHAFG